MEKQQNKYKIKILKNIALLIISLISFTITAQTNDSLDYSNPKTYEIGGIMVTGADNLNSSTLIAISGLVIGEPIKIPGDEITKAITKLWEQGLFSNVDIAIEKIVDNTLFLTIKLKEHPRLSKFKFTGKKVSKADITTLKKELKSFDPDVLVAPPSVLLMLIGCSKPKRVICVAEKLNLSDEIHLEKGYGVKIHQIYQATEGFLGFTCSHGTIHLNEDLLIIEKEYLDDKRFIPIITDLFRKTQPIIRYRLDDILVEKKSSCPCGLHFLALEQIEGRSNDVLYVKNPQGSYKPLFADFIARRITFTDENIQEYEVVQTACDELCIYLDEPYRAKVLDALKQLFKEIDAFTPKITFKKPKVRLNLDQKLRRIRRECEAL